MNIMATKITVELIISVCAISLTIYQAFLTRRHNQLSVRPHLSWNIEKTWSDTSVDVRFVLKNNGVGPAIINDRYFEIDGQRFKANQCNDVEAVAKALIPEEFQYRLSQNGLPGIGTAITAGNEFLVAHVMFFGKKQPTEQQLTDIMGRAAFRADYESLYREKARL